MQKKLAILIVCLVGLITTQSVVGLQLDDWSKVRGKISMKDGTPIEGAAVVITNSDTGRVYSASTKKKGQFAFNRVLPGNYSYAVEKKGYMAFTGEFHVARKGRKILELKLVKETPDAALTSKRAVDLYNEGVELSRAGQYGPAIEKFGESLGLDPERGEAYHNLGAAYLELDRTDEAELAFLDALDLDPDFNPSKAALAELYSQQGNALVEDGLFDVAFDVLSEAYSHDPEHAHVNYLLGVLYVKRGEESQAIQHFDVYLRLEPESKYADEVKATLEKLKLDD